MPEPSQTRARFRRFFKRLLPSHGVANAPTAQAGTCSHSISVSRDSTQPQGQPVTSTPTTIQIDISDVPEALRPELGLPPRVPVLHVDSEDWAIVQGNFVAPLGHPFDPDDPEKPEEFAIGIDIRNSERVHFVQAPQHPWPLPSRDQEEEADKETTNSKPPPPPPYNWAAVSVLPQPTNIANWSAIFAAQREMSRLLEIQSYIETRIAEIKRECMLRERTKLIPAWQLTYLQARSVALLSPVVRLRYDPGDRDLNRVRDEMTKVMFVRERLSPVSFLSFQGSASSGDGDGHGEEHWGWDWDVARLQEARRRHADEENAGTVRLPPGKATVEHIYDHAGTF